MRRYIQEHGLGAGNWIGGEVAHGGRRIGRISWNGRCWPGEPSPAQADSGPGGLGGRAAGKSSGGDSQAQ
ncbi:MAG: hypothetical protein ACLQVX_10795 [Limisphaerales bacterium]